jgi:hypothetical protein
MAKAMKSSGLYDVGFQYLNLDDCKCAMLNAWLYLARV